MEREIKFRVWDVDNKKWVKFLMLCVDLFMPKSWHKVSQFTGLKDKNGVDIYEGDILNCQDRIVQVVWHKEAGQFDTVFIKYIFDLCSNGITNQEWKYRAIVIGNIYENPNLLE